MGSLFNDRPVRRLSLEDDEDLRPSSACVHLFLDPRFFCQRDRDMRPEEGKMSQRILSTVATSDAHCIVLMAAADQRYQEPLEAAGFDLFHMNPQQSVVSAKMLKQKLIELGIRFKYIDNPRRLTWLNMHEFVAAGEIQSFARDDYEKYGIEPDKEVTFQDLADRRKKNAWL